MNPMHASMSNNKNRTWLLLLLLLFLSLLSPSLSDPRISQAGLNCGTVRAPPKANFIPTFVKEMESISQIVANQHWGTHFVNLTVPIYGLAQCFQDLSHTDCLLCHTASRTKLPRCLPSISARIYLDGCFLRYDNYSFYRESTDPSRDTVNCSSKNVLVHESGMLGFVRNVKFVVGNVTTAAVKNGGFGVGEVEGVYALAQCWKTLGTGGCRACLEKAAMAVGKCGPKREGRAMNAGCYLRYSTEKFYNDEQESRNSGFSVSTGAIIAIVLTGAAFIMLSLFAAYAAHARLSSIKERNKLGKIGSSINKSSLNFKYETLEKATDYFSPSNKIGQGGAGSVYKGKLQNGETVAVKRLVFNTRQWVDDFFNEVNLISGIQHKNLVKLLGCSIEGPESLLVYEYVPKRSLDQFLFAAEKNKAQILTWKQRLHIIVGTAEGLAYLHGGCRVRIIHRDIKSSNVLLDDNLNPKIADFGLARCFAADKSHLSTGIAGTLGYMAPEYLIRGQLTDKADVYSFGVLVLEIVCGRRNSAFTQDSGSLLQTVWKLYKSNELAEAVDPCLRDDFPANEASNVLQIGLLCTQASITLRPSMAEVVTLLTNSKETEIPVPNQPPFLNASVLEPTSSIRSCSTHSLASNTFTKVEAYSTFTELSSGRSSDGPSTSKEYQAYN